MEIEDQKGYIERKMEDREASRKRIGHDNCTEDLLEKERYGHLKRRAEDRQEWRVWLPGTCRI